MLISRIWTCKLESINSLDADDTPLYSQALKKHMERDIVQFVPFQQFKDDPHRLAR